MIKHIITAIALALGMVGFISALGFFGCAAQKPEIKNCLDYDPIEYSVEYLDAMIAAGKCRIERN